MKDTIQVLAVTSVPFFTRCMDWFGKESNSLTGLAALLACAYTCRKFWISFRKRKQRKEETDL